MNIEGDYKKYVPAVIEDLNPMEIWWPVEGNIYFNGELILHIPLGEYEASNCRRIRSLNYGGIKGNVQMLRQHYLHNGSFDNDWLQVRILGKQVRSHTVIALAYLGERPEGHEVDHLNYRRDDNRIENLMYRPKSENCCRHSADGVHNHKESMDKLWSDEEFREQKSLELTLKKQDQEFEQKRKEGFDKKWDDEEFVNEHKERSSKIMTELNQREDFAEERNKRSSKNMTMLNQDVDFANKRDERIRERWKDNDFRKKMSDKMKKQLEDDDFRNKGIEASKKAFSKPVIQYDKQENLIAEFQSVTEASLQTGINLSHIAECCRGGRKSAGGCIWKYKEVA